MKQPRHSWSLLRRLVLESRLIRVVQLSTKGRLTQFVERIELQLRLKGSRSKYRPPIIVVVSPVAPPNDALRDFYRAHVVFIDAESSRVLLRIFARLAVARPRPLLFERESAARRRLAAWDLSHTHQADASWTRETVEMLEEMQIPRDRSIVLLSTRSASYYRELRRKPGGERAGSETREDTMVRNPNIITYLPAARFLQSKGFVVVRIGVHQEPLSTEWDGVAIDYASQFRTPRRDLLLARRCQFLLNGTSGAWSLTAMFNRPNLNVDCYRPFASAAFSSRDVFAHQLIRDTKSGRLLTFREMATVGLSAQFQERATRDGLQLVPHTEDLITDMVCEMLSRMAGSFVESSADQRRRLRFEEAKQIAGKGLRERGSVSAVYLQRFEELLE